MLLQFDVNGDVFVVEVKNETFVKDVQNNILEIIKLRQNILRLFLVNLIFKI